MGFAADSILFSFAVFDTGVIILILYFSIITLENFIKNADADERKRRCDKLNYLCVLKALIHGFLSFLILMNCHPYIFLVNFPVLVWEVCEIIGAKEVGLGVYDPGEMADDEELGKAVKDCKAAFSFYVAICAIYLYYLLFG